MFSVSQHGVFILVLCFWRIIPTDLVLHHLSLKILIMHSKCLKQYSSQYIRNFITIAYVENIVFRFEILFFCFGSFFLALFHIGLSILPCPFLFIPCQNHHGRVTMVAREPPKLMKGFSFPTNSMSHILYYLKPL